MENEVVAQPAKMVKPQFAAITPKDLAVRLEYMQCHLTTRRVENRRPAKFLFQRTDIHH